MQLLRSAGFGLPALGVFTRQLSATEFMKNCLSCTQVAYPLVFTLIIFFCLVLELVELFTSPSLVPHVSVGSGYGALPHRGVVRSHGCVML